MPVPIRPRLLYSHRRHKCVQRDSLFQLSVRRSIRPIIDQSVTVFDFAPVRGSDRHHCAYDFRHGRVMTTVD